LGIEPQEVIDIVRDGLSEKDICLRFEELLPNDLQAHKWNRKVVQMGMSSIAKEKLEEVKVDMGAAGRDDLISFADVIEYDEGRID
jgi:hypothetical protein